LGGGNVGFNVAGGGGSGGCFNGGGSKSGGCSKGDGLDGAEAARPGGSEAAAAGTGALALPLNAGRLRAHSSSVAVDATVLSQLRMETSAAIVASASHQSAISPQLPGAGGVESVPEDVPVEVGASGEYFVFLQLQAMLPDFDAGCWVSALKAHYMPSSPANDRAYGCDFIYHDKHGSLCGVSGVTYFVECKSTTLSAPIPFRMSANEWQRAVTCHQSGGSEVYMLALVTATTTAPKIAKLLTDPLLMVAQGRASCSWSELIFSPPT